MTINKYTGKTEEEAMTKVRNELGNAAVIMNVKVIKPKGLGSFFKKSTYEVTAAVEDDDISKLENAKASNTMDSSFDAVADDAVLLKNAFSAVNEVLEKQKEEVPQVNTMGQETHTFEAETPVDETKNLFEEDVDFEPLAGTAKRAKLYEATYQKPTYSKPSPQPKKPADNAVSSPEIKLTTPIKPEKEDMEKVSIDNDNHVFVKMLYNVLLDNEVQEKYINNVICMSRFFIRNSVRCKYLASKVLSLCMKRFSADFKEEYGYEPLMVESYIGHDYDGTSYKAANWTYLGITEGYDYNGSGGKSAVHKKDYYLYILKKDFRKRLGVVENKDFISHKRNIIRSKIDGLHIDKWLPNELGGIDFGDIRRTKTFLRLVTIWFSHPDSALGNILKGKRKREIIKDNPDDEDENDSNYEEEEYEYEEEYEEEGGDKDSDYIYEENEEINNNNNKRERKNFSNKKRIKRLEQKEITLRNENENENENRNENKEINKTITIVNNSESNQNNQNNQNDDYRESGIKITRLIRSNNKKKRVYRTRKVKVINTADKGEKRRRTQRKAQKKIGIFFQKI